MRLMITSLPVVLNGVYLFFSCMNYPDLSCRSKINWLDISYWIFPRTPSPLPL
jgi:hypothetical protein